MNRATTGFDLGPLLAMKNTGEAEAAQPLRAVQVPTVGRDLHLIVPPGGAPEGVTLLPGQPVACKVVAVLPPVDAGGVMFDMVNVVAWDARGLSFGVEGLPVAGADEVVPADIVHARWPRRVGGH